MNFNFLPSLRHMASVTIASQLLQDSDIEQLMEDSSGLEYWETVEEKAEEKLPQLPSSLKTEVGKFIHPMQLYCLSCVEDHSFLERRDDKIHYKRSLCWKTDGTLNKTQTAKKFVRNIHVDLMSRFVMACVYFLKHEVMHLWKKIEKSGRGTLVGESRTNLAVGFWMSYIKNGCRGSWKKYVYKHFDPYNLKSDSRIRMSCFFCYLPRMSRLEFIRSVNFSMCHEDDLRLCLYEMNENERKEFYAEFPSDTLLCYLKWPLQELFIAMANLLWPHMTIHDLEAVLDDLLDYTVNEFGYCDYRDILEQLLSFTPVSLKKELMENINMYKTIETTLSRN